MSYRDKWEVDENGNKFLFTVEMQRKLAEKGLPVEAENVTEVSSNPPTPKQQNQNAPSTDHKQEEQAPASESIDFSIPTTIQIDPQTGKYIGRMKWYNQKKGYGFIVRGGGEEIFFHKTGVAGEPNSLQEGEWILYDVEETRKGPEATDIEPYSGDTSLLN